MKLINKNILFFALQVLLGSVFIFSGCVKLLDLNAFYEALINFKLFNGHLLVFLEYFIPIAEVLLGFLIIFNFSSSIPSFLASFILSLFTSLIVAKLFEGENLSCGCFGNFSNSKLDVYSVLRNLILISLSVIIAIYNESQKLLEKTRQNFIKIIRLILLTNLIFYLAAQNMIFALQNNGLKGRLSLLIENENILQSGERVKDFDLNSIKGEKRRIEYSKNLTKKSLLFVLKPTCQPCKHNLGNWENIYELIDTAKVRILGVSLDKFEMTSRYVSENKVYFPVYYLEDSEFLINYKTYLTPQTILIDKKGIVIKVWKGILDKNSITEIIYQINKQEA